MDHGPKAKQSFAAGKSCDNAASKKHVNRSLDRIVSIRSSMQKAGRIMDRWRTPEAEAYRRLYQTKRWKRLREVALLRDLFTCQRCGCHLKRGRTHPQSAVVPHIKAHKGDW